MAEFEIISGSHNATPSPRTLCITRGIHCEWTRMRMHQFYTPAPHPYVGVRPCTSLLHYIQAQDHPAVTHGQPAPSSLALNHKRNPEELTTLTHVTILRFTLTPSEERKTFAGTRLPWVRPATCAASRPSSSSIANILVIATENCVWSRSCMCVRVCMSLCMSGCVRACMHGAERAFQRGKVSE